MRSFILFLGLLSCSVSALADWNTKVVRDPVADFSQYSLQASDNFPLITFSCVSFDASPFDVLQIDRLTRIESGTIQEIEIRVDSNLAMRFYPDQHKININYTYHVQLESGIETVTLVPSNDSGKNQFAELVRQFIDGYSGVAQVKTATNETQVEFSLMGFTQAYLAMRTACLSN